VVVINHPPLGRVVAERYHHRKVVGAAAVAVVEVDLIFLFLEGQFVGWE
jgi:hypothetical protein